MLILGGGYNLNLNITTFILVLSLILASQVIALFVQYRVNNNFKGIGYWLLGSGLMAMGFILMTLVTSDSLAVFARVANPIFILALIFWYVGIKHFFYKKIQNWICFSIFILFNLFYYYYMFIDNSISGRTISISITIAIISYLIAKELFSQKDVLVFGSAQFTAVIFSLYGGFFLIRAFFEIALPPAQSYFDQGSTLLISLIFSSIFSNLWTYGLIIMLNQRLNIENKLEKEKLLLIFNTNIDAQLITRLDDGLIVDANDRYLDISGYDKEEIIGKFIQDNTFWNDPEDRKFFIQELIDKETCKNYEFIFKTKDGKCFSSLISARIIRFNSVAHIISVIRNITKRKEFENALIESEEKYRSILNASPDDITITDLDANIIMISPAAKEMFGYDLDFDNFIGMKLLDFIVPEDVDRARANIVKMYEGYTRSTNEYKAVRQDKSEFDVEVNSGFVFNAKGIPDKMVFIIRDITRRKLIESEMQELVNQLEIEKNTAQLNAITDSLSGLFNRGYFDRMLRTEFSRLARSESRISLVMFDIDNFKKYNDNYGHLAGDKCIQMISQTLKASLERDQDIAARYGGEEFIVILPDTGENGARTIGERIRKAIEDLEIPHIGSETSKYVTVSVGAITVYSDNLITPDQALKLVDEALYTAKGNGRNCCVYISKGKQTSCF